MKILIATESYWPNISGVAVFSHNLAKKMADRGHEVFVIAPSPKFHYYEEIKDGVKIFRLPSHLNKFRKDHYNAKIPFKYIKKIIFDIKPDVVHLQDPMLISYATIHYAKKIKIPIVITNHFSLEYVVSYLPFLKPIHPLIIFILSHYLNWFYAKANVLTCPSKTIADQFKSSKIKTKIEVISNGVDVSRFMPRFGDIDLIRSRYKIPRKHPVILFVGRLDIDKQVDELLKAIKIVIQKNIAHFVIVGDGKERENLVNLSHQLNITDYVTFIKFIPYNDKTLPKIYQTASIFVNPCPIETQSIVTLEAEATGLPCVVVDSGALIELVKNGINGYRYKKNDVNDFADKIIKIINDKKLAKKMGDESLQIIEKHLVEDTYNKYEEIYEKIT